MRTASPSPTSSPGGQSARPARPRRAAGLPVSDCTVGPAARRHGEDRPGAPPPRPDGDGQHHRRRRRVRAPWWPALPAAGSRAARAAGPDGAGPASGARLRQPTHSRRWSSTSSARAGGSAPRRRRVEQGQDVRAPSDGLDGRCRRAFRGDGAVARRRYAATPAPPPAAPRSPRAASSRTAAIASSSVAHSASAVAVPSRPAWSLIARLSSRSGVRPSAAGARGAASPRP